MPERDGLRANPVVTLGGWLLLGAIMASAGAAVIVSPLFLGVELVLLMIVASSAYRESHWRFLALATIVVSPAALLGDGQPVPNGDAAQKAIMLVALLCLVISLGTCWSGVGAGAAAVIGLVGIVSIANVGGQIDVDDGTVVRAAIGYVLPWLFWFVDWRRLHLATGLTFLACLPLVCVLVGVVLQAIGMSTVFVVIDSDVPRLQGASIPAHLAMLALVGLAASLCLLSRAPDDRHRGPYLWVAINLVLLFGTVTRGPIIVAGLLVITFLFRAVIDRRGLSVRVRRAAALIGVVSAALIAVAAPELIRRSIGNSYEGAINTSGRDRAWEFFAELAVQSPWTGKGLGFTPLAVQLYLPMGVQEDFHAPHNEYIHLFLDGGVVLVVGISLLTIGGFIVAARSQHRTTRSLILALLVGTAFYAYVDNPFSTPQFMIPIVMLLGLLAAHPDRPPTRSDPGPPGNAQSVGERVPVLESAGWTPTRREVMTDGQMANGTTISSPASAQRFPD